MCDQLGVSSSGYYAWHFRPESKRVRADAELWSQIEKVHDESPGIYGYRRIREALLQLGIRASRRRIARLMRENGRRGKQFRRYVITTKPGKRLPHVPDLVQRTFAARRPNQVWVSDITYVRTKQGWLYLAAILDSRHVVGWAMLPNITTDLVKQALKMAFRHRQPSAGLIFHSDRGSQYTSDTFQHLLKIYRLQPSLGRTGSCFDNAVMESFFGTLKNEWLYHQRFATRQEARQSIFYFIEVFYNQKRLHSANNYLSPTQFEALGLWQGNLPYQPVY